MNKKALSVALSALLLPQFSVLADAGEADNEHKLVVTAEFEPAESWQLSGSASVVSEEAIASRQAESLEDILALVPNVNFATGASRGRFVQIRGIGERSEFVDPVNYSVGVIVDGIDMTGIAMGATLLDVAQVEVLRGPQGTLYGANALAGLINIVSNPSSADPGGRLRFGAAQYGGRELEAVYSQPINDDWGYRVAVGQHQSDGFMENVFLGRDDTNNIDETTVKARFDYQGEQVDLTSHLLWLDIDNGYDAFSLDNTRQTYSDEPGRDTQQTLGVAFDLKYSLSPRLTLHALLSHASSELSYGYDEDWSHPGICDGTPCDSSLFGFDWWYQSTDRYDRDNDNTSLDVRVKKSLAVGYWVLGIYQRQQQVDLLRDYTFNAGPFNSSLETTNRAIYGQIKHQLSGPWSIETGLRFEQRSADYMDSEGVSLSPDDDLWGGKVALQYQLDSRQMAYALASRGYKSGGFNTDGSLLPEERSFDTEFMWNYELGLKGQSENARLNWQLAIFYQDRKDVQSKQSIVRSLSDGRLISEGGVCPCSFTDYITNAAAGVNQGLELSMDYRPMDNLRLYLNWGWLDATFKDFVSFSHVDADPANGVGVDMDGREQAHAPKYSGVIGMDWWFAQQWQLQLQVEAKDDFFFSDRHNVRADSYTLLNLAMVYEQGDWQVTLYGHNLTDELVMTRGFGSFGNDPRKFYVTEPYFQYGEPRLYGVRVDYQF